MPPAVADNTRITINRTDVNLVIDDLTALDVEAFVFYAAESLALGSGYGTAISNRGGPSIQKALDALAPVATGEAVVTEAGKLKAAWIIHAVGPKFQEPRIEAKLRTTMRNTLARAEEKQIGRLTFPAMGAGYYGIDPALCARVMLEEIKSHVEGDTALQEIIICVLDSTQHKAFQSRMADLA
jgi:O-acetyl-ADP-ribose deacetylase (regulator of RNase III)